MRPDILDKRKRIRSSTALDPLRADGPLDEALMVGLAVSVGAYFSWRPTRMESELTKDRIVSSRDWETHSDKNKSKNTENSECIW